jgi:hypothetical protein
MMATCNAVAALTGIPIAGALIVPGKWSGGFGPAILFSGLMCALGCGFYVAARVHMVGWKVSAKR